MKKRAYFKLVIFSISVLLLNSGLAIAHMGQGNDLTFATESNTIVFLGEEFKLLDTFVNPDAALAEAKRNSEVTIGHVALSRNLMPLTVETASDYKQEILESGQLSASEESDFLTFLDLYENPSENTAILRELERIEDEYRSNKISYSEAIEAARMFLPSKPENGNEMRSAQIMNSGINLTAARRYAETWAIRANPKYGEEKNFWGYSVDCTNFASQILHAGGISMHSSTSIYNGWWWSNPRKRSISWINANVFKNYMGYNFRTNTWKGLVENVRDGDLIGLDYSNDGTLDHIGFVHTKSGGRLRIAQHTSNYLDWNGGWPNYNGKGMYYRVRR
ncbi:MAG: amidase domain-containing protein [Actinomycetaceae bacterium]|nr:amidase domain-containing protein [Actinomycetaceae bacterium]